MTFDGPNKLVILSSTTLDLIALWSNWKDWLLAGNAGYALAFDTVGGEPIDPVAGTLVPLTLFQKNNWSIRPMESDHTLDVTNGTLVREGGGDPFVSTLGDFTVRIRYQQPVQAIGYSTAGGSGPSAADIAAAVWSKVIEGALTAEQIQRLLLAVSAGDATGLESGAPLFKSQDGTKNRVAAAYSTGTRVVTARDAT